jgi:glycosyltransferase involved in cell wall biosynthesis
MRTAVVVQSAVYGGAESYLNRLYEALRARGDDPILLGSNPGWDLTGLPRVPLPLSPKWSGKTIFSGVLKVPAERRYLGRALEGIRPDLFHLQFKREQIGFTSFLAGRAPVVWTEHGRFLKGLKGALLAEAYKHAARHAAAIICVSDDVAADVRHIVGSRTRIEVIENAVNTFRLRPADEMERAHARAVLGIPLDQPVLLWIGRLHREKRPSFAVELGKIWPGVTLIAGDGKERGAVEEAAVGMTNVRVLGHVEDTAPLYQAADVLAFTSTSHSREGLPTTLIEAAAYGVPIVAGEESLAGDLLQRMGAVTVPTGGSAERWVMEMLGATKGPLSRRVRTWAESHDVESWSRAHRMVFASVMRNC